MATVSNHPAGQGVPLTAFQRHQKLVSDYLRFYGGDESTAAVASTSAVRTDQDVLKDSYRFIRNQEDDEGGGREVRLALRYYERLFKEYGIADLSLYRESKVGIRWRTQAEVVSGKGQFTCASKGCDVTAGLCSYEVNFIYLEAAQRRQALVKLRVCAACAHKLNYKKEKQYRKAAAGGGGGGGGHGVKRGRAAEDAAGGEHAEGRGPRVAERQPRGSGWDPASYAPSQPAFMPEGAARPPSSSAAAAETPEESAAAAAAAAASVLPGDDSIWEAKRKVEEASAEEEIDEYFTGLFD